MPRKLRVALVGGSISGCTLANGLLKHPHIDFHVFESRASFTETGASVGLAANAMNSLKAIGIDVDRMRQDSGATSMSSTRYFVVGRDHHCNVKDSDEADIGLWQVQRRMHLRITRGRNIRHATRVAT
jgi:salicylate hydroxylase